MDKLDELLDFAKRKLPAEAIKKAEDAEDFCQAEVERISKVVGVEVMESASQAFATLTGKTKLEVAQSMLLPNFDMARFKEMVIVTVDGWLTIVVAELGIAYQQKKKDKLYKNVDQTLN